MLGLNPLLPHAPGQSSHRSLDHSPANYEGYGKTPLLGLFPLFSEHFGTVDPVKVSQLRVMLNMQYTQQG